MAENDSDFLGGLLDVLFRLSSLHPPQVKAGGYSDDIFCSLSDDEKEEFTCAICYQILKDVRQCINRHKFCAPCIYVWSTGGNGVNRSRCPVCRTHGFYLRDLVLDNKIQSKMVACRLKACGWSGKLKHLATHRHLNYGATVGSNLPTGLTPRSGSRLQRLPRIEDAESRPVGQYTSRLPGLATSRSGSQTPSSSILANNDPIDQTTTHSLFPIGSPNSTVSPDRPTAPGLLSVGSISPAVSSFRRSRIRLPESTDSLARSLIDNTTPSTLAYEPSSSANQLLNRQTQPGTTTAPTIIPHPPTTTRPTLSQPRRPNRTNTRQSLYLLPGTTPRPDTTHLSGATSGAHSGQATTNNTMTPGPSNRDDSSDTILGTNINSNSVSNTIGSNTNIISNTIGTNANSVRTNHSLATGPRRSIVNPSRNANSNTLARPTIIGANSNTSTVTNSASIAASDDTSPPLDSLTNGRNDENANSDINARLQRYEDTLQGHTQSVSTDTGDRYRLRQRLQDNRSRLATFQQSLDGRRRQVEEFQDELERMRREQLTEVRQVWQRLGQLTHELRHILDVQRSDLVTFTRTDTVGDDSNGNDNHDNDTDI